MNYQVFLTPYFQLLLLKANTLSEAQCCAMDHDMHYDSTKDY